MRNAAETQFARKTFSRASRRFSFGLRADAIHAPGKMALVGVETTDCERGERDGVPARPVAQEGAVKGLKEAGGSRPHGHSAN